MESPPDVRICAASNAEYVDKQGDYVIGIVREDNYFADERTTSLAEKECP